MKGDKPVLDSILNGAGTAMMTLPQYFLCTGTSLALGALLAALPLLRAVLDMLLELMG